MVERISALAGLEKPPRIGEGAGVTLAEMRIESLWQIAAWPDSLAEAGRRVANAAGVEGAPGPGLSAVAAGRLLLRTEPLKWWLIGAAPPEMGGSGTRLDLSHARTGLRVEGPAAGAVMARLAPLDFRSPAFAEGRVATAPIHHIGVTIRRGAAGFELYIPRSYARSLWSLVGETAAQFGAEIA